MRWFTELPGQVLRFTVSDGGVWVTTWIVVALTLVLLIVIASHRATHRETIIETTSGVWRFVRRHARGHIGEFWPDQEPVSLVPDVPTSHWAISNEPWHDRDHPLDARQTGAHAADGEVTRALVLPGWQPLIGARRIAFMVGSPA